MHTPSAYHSYAPAVSSNVLSSSSLFSHYVLLLPQLLIIFPIDHPYTHPYIGFHLSAIYHPYTSTLLPHLPHSLPGPHFCTDLSCSPFPILILMQ
ncbi:hypothetical protein O181_080785 [Austropuccinia psidii MF-1]|uniref:Uncharacterized protein n=1 Tax=Austropuccinia psidii MF-1 TaxID=1389203 RepID=A0A9Q3FNU6_9BASI|nr:hypothetical protein [Austropuccinia psidii MF-1]